MREQSDWFRIRSPAGVFYHIGPALDCGGFGCVYQATDASGESLVAKVLGPADDAGGTFSQFCINEVKCLAKCNHPNIVRVRDAFFTRDGVAIIIMERAICSLRDCIQEREKFDLTRICSIGIQVLSALDHIHKLSIIHRDIKPSNILVFPENRVKLADFGISKLLPVAGICAQTFVGYTPYLPPELISEGQSTTRSDLYQCAMVLLCLLLTEEPFDFDAQPEVVRANILDATPRKRAELLIAQGGPIGRLASVLSICLRRRWLCRYQSAGQVREELLAVMMSNLLVEVPADADQLA